MRLKITIKAISIHNELSQLYENPIKDACPYKIGDVFYVDSLNKPDDLCSAAWRVMYPYIMTLLNNGEDIYKGWMKNKKSAMVSCDDGFRPVSFYIEVVENE